MIKLEINRKTVLLNMLSVLSIVLFIIAWLWISAGEESLIPTPKDVYERFIRLTESPISNMSLLGHTWASLKRVLAGVGLACVLGISFGLLIGWSKTFGRLFRPLFEVMRPIPSLAWIPLVTLWLGIGEQSKIALVFIGAVMPIVVNTYTGVKLIPKINIDVAKIFGANQLQVITNIVLPSSVTAIIAGVKTALGSGWIVVLAAEMISANEGLGFLIIRGSNVADLSLVILSMLLISVIGAAMSTSLTYLERGCCPWKEK